MASSASSSLEIASTTDNQKWQYGRQNRDYVYLSLEMTDSIEIPSANLWYSTIASSMKVSLGDCFNDLLPEMAK